MGSGGTEVPFNGGHPQPVFTSQVKLISKLDIPSTRWMSETEKFNETRQMILDLEALAYNDGCIAASWAIEWIQVASRDCDPQQVFLLREALALHRSMVLGGELASSTSELKFQQAMDSST
jgi:hypothetical protein